MKTIICILLISLTTVALADIECGLTAYEIRKTDPAGNKIAGGWYAAPHSLPYQVKLYIEKRDGPTGCGGVIIQLKPGNGTDAILTAAHCVYEKTLRRPVTADKIDVVSGAHDLENHFEESQRKIPVKNFVVHPDYNSGNLLADIALLKLKEKIPYTDKTRPACLPNKDDELIPKEMCYASGWGAHFSGGDMGTVLKMAVLPVQPAEKCNVAGAPASKFCAGGGFGGHGACQGDSGGPLACERNGRLVVFGLASGTTGLCGEYNKPATFTKVSAFLDWISKTDKELDTAKDMSNGKKAENLAQPLDSDETTDTKQAGKVTEPFPCGLSAFPMKKEASPSNRVSGGWETRPNSVPYQVKLINKKYGGEFGCGGTLIQFKPGNGTIWVLTAAHCIYDSNRKKMLEPDKIEVLVGAHNVYKLDEETRKKVLVKNVIMHPQYNDRTVENDIALLQLKETVFYTTTTRPACLPKPGEKPLPTTLCWVSGWGAEMSFGQTSEILNVAKVDIWNDADCKANSNTIICLGGRKDRRGACQGDSGGPLLCEHNKRMVVFGVSSSIMGHCGQLNKPSLYTRVTFYLDWLAESSKNSGDLNGSASSTVGSSAISKPNKAKDDFEVRPSAQMTSPPKVSNVPSQPAFPGSRFMTPLPSPRPSATSRFYTPSSSSGLSRSRFQTL
ncbi:Transmembrane protease serine 9 [Trichinella zimbabwensis]|uniref:Transmembrane protease serine 9 n=1 Tax=Trichinella zimbabwensis TaxID=268475 RepID=A0A0V1HSL9_9BILA|nr:Transmembrane protease serine 9 [Trichinella zimbabwensis]